MCVCGLKGNWSSTLILHEAWEKTSAVAPHDFHIKNENKSYKRKSHKDDDNNKIKRIKEKKSSTTRRCQGIGLYAITNNMI